MSLGQTASAGGGVADRGAESSSSVASLSTSSPSSTPRGRAGVLAEAHVGQEHEPGVDSRRARARWTIPSSSPAPGHPRPSSGIPNSRRARAKLGRLFGLGDESRPSAAQREQVGIRLGRGADESGRTKSSRSRPRLARERAQAVAARSRADEWRGTLTPTIYALQPARARRRPRRARPATLRAGRFPRGSGRRARR